MKIDFQYQGNPFTADLSRPHDLSIPLRDGLENPNCFWAPPVEFSPVVAGSFVGSTAQGSPVNFYNVRLNPHGNGTHTECVGHIAKEKYTINDCLWQFHFLAKLATVYPTKMDDGDRVVLRNQLEEVLQPAECEAFILRTMPNDAYKLTANYSGTKRNSVNTNTVADWKNKIQTRKTFRRSHLRVEARAALPGLHFLYPDESGYERFSD